MKSYTDVLASEGHEEIELKALTLVNLVYPQGYGFGPYFVVPSS